MEVINSIETAENIQLHHDLAMAIMESQKEVFPENIATNPIPGYIYQTNGIEEILVVDSDQLWTEHPDFQAHRIKSINDHDQPTIIYFLRLNENLRISAAYSQPKSDSPDDPESITVTMENKTANTLTEISTVLSGMATKVDVNGETQTPEISTQILTDLIQEISHFRLEASHTYSSY